MQEETTMAANAAAGETAQPSFAREAAESAPELSAEKTLLPTDEAAQAEREPEADSLTRAFSERLKAVSQKRVDAFVEGMGLIDPFHGGRPIRTRQQYEDWVQALQAQPMPDNAPETVGDDAPQTAQRLREELEQLRCAQRDRELLADPEQGPVYARLRGDVQQLLQACRQQNAPVSTDAAYAAVLLRELPALQKAAAETARQEALRAVQANGQASPGALGGPSAADTPDFERMTSGEFAEYHRRALRGEWQ